MSRRESVSVLQSIVLIVSTLVLFSFGKVSTKKVYSQPVNNPPETGYNIIINSPEDQLYHFNFDDLDGQISDPDGDDIESILVYPFSTPYGVIKQNGVDLPADDQGYVDQFEVTLEEFETLTIQHPQDINYNTFQRGGYFHLYPFDGQQYSISSQIFHVRVSPVADLPVGVEDRVEVEQGADPFIIDVLDNDYGLDINYSTSSSSFDGSINITYDTQISNIQGDTGAVISVNNNRDINDGSQLHQIIDDKYPTINVNLDQYQSTSGSVTVDTTDTFNGVLTFDYELCEFADGLVDCSTAPVIVEVDNEPPVVENISVDYNDTFQFSEEFFIPFYSDQNLDTPKSIRIESPLPTNGNLYLDEVIVTVDQEIPFTDVNLLEYRSNEGLVLNVFNTEVVNRETITFSISDGAQYSSPSEIVFQETVQTSETGSDNTLDNDNTGLIRTGGI